MSRLLFSFFLVKGMSHVIELKHDILYLVTNPLTSHESHVLVGCMYCEKPNILYGMDLVLLDMVKRASWVEFGSSQSGYGSNRLLVKIGHFKQVKNGFGSIGLRVGSGWPIFSNDFFFFLIKKTTYICYLKSHATNYLI